MTRFAFSSSTSARSARRVSSAISRSRRSAGLRPRDWPSSFSAPSRTCLRQYLAGDARYVRSPRLPRATRLERLPGVGRSIERHRESGRTSCTSPRFMADESASTYSRVRGSLLVPATCGHAPASDKHFAPDLGACASCGTSAGVSSHDAEGPVAAATDEREQSGAAAGGLASR
jgi:hypothetical protein